MLELLSNQDLVPFVIAISIVFALAAIEIVGAFSGLSASSFLDNLLPDLEIDTDIEVDTSGVEADAAGASLFQSALAWLCIGRVPALVVLIIFLTAFGVTGVVVQLLLSSVVGTTGPAAMVALPAFLAALPLTRAGGLGLARVMPKEYSEAASQTEFIGRTATVIRGTARTNMPAEAKVKGPFGKTHYVLLEPDSDTDAFDQGTEAVIVGQKGAVYRAVADFDAYVAAANSEPTKTDIKQ